MSTEITYALYVLAVEIKKKEEKQRKAIKCSPACSVLTSL